MAERTGNFLTGLFSGWENPDAEEILAIEEAREKARRALRADFDAGNVVGESPDGKTKVSLSFDGGSNKDLRILANSRA